MAIAWIKLETHYSAGRPQHHLTRNGYGQIISPETVEALKYAIEKAQEDIPNGSTGLELCLKFKSPKPKKRK